MATRDGGSEHPKGSAPPAAHESPATPDVAGDIGRLMPRDAVFTLHFLGESQSRLLEDARRLDHLGEDRPRAQETNQSPALVSPAKGGVSPPPKGARDAHPPPAKR
jgi:hypothetical protein